MDRGVARVVRKPPARTPLGQPEQDLSWAPGSIGNAVSLHLRHLAGPPFPDLHMGAVLETACQCSWEGSTMSRGSH